MSSDSAGRNASNGQSLQWGTTSHPRHLSQVRTTEGAKRWWKFKTRGFDDEVET